MITDVILSVAKDDTRAQGNLPNRQRPARGGMAESFGVCTMLMPWLFHGYETP
jgi:hypothetical protein